MPLTNVLDFLEANGFNAIRMPIAVSAVLEGTHPKCMEDGGFYYNKNRPLVNMDFPSLIRHVVREAGKRGILIMLDLHSMAPGLWPDDGVVGISEAQQLRNAWAVLADYLCPTVFWNVFAADLKNEPHGMCACTWMVRFLPARLHLSLAGTGGVGDRRRAGIWFQLL